jgi:putative endonuclease
MNNVFVYILKLSDFSYYTGITKHIDIRLKEHNEGQSLSTKNLLPFKLIYLQKYDNYVQAREYEKSIKRQGAVRFLNKLYFKKNTNFIYFDVSYIENNLNNNSRWQKLHIQA